MKIPLLVSLVLGALSIVAASACGEERAAPPTASPTLPAATQMIAYGFEDHDLYAFLRVATLDGGSVAEFALGQYAFFPFGISWSPDGRRISFCTLGASGALWIADLQTFRASRIVDGTCSWTDWSADDMILFSGPEHMGESVLHAVRGDGTGLQTLTHDPDDFDTEPSWSPDGSRVVFNRMYLCSRDPGQPDLYVMSADGGDLASLTDDDWGETVPVWSPDGSYVAFAAHPLEPLHGPWPNTCRARTGPDELFIVGADGAGRRSLGAGTDPVWSPDGSRLAYVLSNHIWVINADGTGAQDVTPDGPGALWPMWTKDGTEIVFCDGSALFAVDPATGRTRLIVEPTVCPAGVHSHSLY